MIAVQGRASGRSNDQVVIRPVHGHGLGFGVLGFRVCQHLNFVLVLHGHQMNKGRGRTDAPVPGIVDIEAARRVGIGIVRRDIVIVNSTIDLIRVRSGRFNHGFSFVQPFPVVEFRVGGFLHDGPAQFGFLLLGQVDNVLTVLLDESIINCDCHSNSLLSKGIKLR